MLGKLISSEINAEILRYCWPNTYRNQHFCPFVFASMKYSINSLHRFNKHLYFGVRIFQLCSVKWDLVSSLRKRIREKFIRKFNHTNPLKFQLNFKHFSLKVNEKRHSFCFLLQIAIVEKQVSISNWHAIAKFNQRKTLAFFFSSFGYQYSKRWGIAILWTSKASNQTRSGIDISTSI